MSPPLLCRRVGGHLDRGAGHPVGEAVSGALRIAPSRRDPLAPRAPESLRQSSPLLSCTAKDRDRVIML